MILYRLALASSILVGFEGCFANIRQESNSQFTDVKPVISSQLPTDALTTRKRKQRNAAIGQIVSSPKVENSQPVSVELPLVQESGIENRVPLNGSQFYSINSKEPVKQGSYMTLMPMGGINALGNPFYRINLYANGHLLHSYPTVSGRAYTQNRNRDRAGTEAPLPDGKYKIARAPIPGTIPEAGNLFLPIQPLFQTGRSALGIHYDPSFEKNNGEDGTSGCIALTNKGQLDDLLNYVRIYQPEYLEVNIQ